MLLIWDNLRGHYTTDMVLWLFEHGIMPLYTPLGGSWLNMAESMQRILFQRGLAGQSPESPLEIISSLEAVARIWNRVQHPLSGVESARLVVNATGSVNTLLAVPVRTPATQYIEEQPSSRIGNAHAKRPTSSLRYKRRRYSKINWSAALLLNS